jgi:hypothetical protein
MEKEKKNEITNEYSKENKMKIELKMQFQRKKKNINLKDNNSEEYLKK